MAQLIIHYNDGQGNVEIFTSEPTINFNGFSYSESRANLRNAIKEVLSFILTDKWPNDEIEGIPTIQKYISKIKELEVRDSGGNNKPEINLYLSEETINTRIFDLVDVDEEPMELQEILDKFDEWALQTRARIEQLYKDGNLPVGTTFELQDELDYFSEFPMGIPDKYRARNKRRGPGYSKSPNEDFEYNGTITI